MALPDLNGDRTSAIVPQESLTFWICNVTWWQTLQDVDPHSLTSLHFALSVFVAFRSGHWCSLQSFVLWGALSCTGKPCAFGPLTALLFNTKSFSVRMLTTSSRMTQLLNVYICLLFLVFWNSDVLNLPSTFRDWKQCWSQVGTHADLLGSRRSAILQAVDSRVQNLFLGAPFPFESKYILSKTENKQQLK